MNNREKSEGDFSLFRDMQQIESWVSFTEIGQTVVERGLKH